MERTTQINWLPILNSWTPLTWSRLTDPDMVDRCIWVIYPYPQKSEDPFTEEVLKVVGMDRIDGKWALVVKNWDNEDFLILEEGKGTLWEAYEIKTGI